MNITNLDFLLTFGCNARCKHCSYQAGPHREKFIPAEQAQAWLVELNGIRPLQSITIHGGEPFLFFQEMLSILAKAGELGIKHRWVITNGFWAENAVTAETKLKDLKNAGLNAITFSVDGFHQEYIAFDTVRIGIESAMLLGFDRVAVDSYFLYSEDDDNAYNIRTKEYHEKLKNIPGLVVNSFTASFEGRAAALLVEDEYRKENILQQGCHPPGWLGGSLQDPETIEIDCEGNVTLCPGISTGNAYSESLTEVVSRYDCKRHPIIRAIVEKGPVGLLDLARSHGYEQNQNFVNECHLCYEMRKYLCGQYDQYLAPLGCYRDT
jgi:organic radical activating enzyme